ncbi:hypothetical protein PoB_003751600 [Plakobranchus ocellatus]|uniref:Uncharacterized protein n=1 Tax=Plakobranchus ocellatus TaxID=259542 RepID=A0AAV4AWW6_9GAST|nr:hypothetical protein PoB_003751600 [Plakobranchus ocellatus]
MKGARRRRKKNRTRFGPLGPGSRQNLQTHRAWPRASRGNKQTIPRDKHIVRYYTNLSTGLGYVYAIRKKEKGFRERRWRDDWVDGWMDGWMDGWIIRDGDRARDGKKMGRNDSAMVSGDTGFGY